MTSVFLYKERQKRQKASQAVVKDNGNFIKEPQLPSITDNGNYRKETFVPFKVTIAITITISI
jgi:hypothetical protein